MFNFFRKDRPEEEVNELPSQDFSQADIVINGSMTGRVEGQCDVVIGETGEYVGVLKVKDLAIHGTVMGDVYADELVVHPTGQLYFRNVFAHNTIIHDGGVYTAHRNIIDKVNIGENEDEDFVAIEIAADKPLGSEGLTSDQRNKDFLIKPKKGPTFISTY